MKAGLFTIAIKNGQYISINEFNPGDGERCGCICPDCGEKVRSNISSKMPQELKKNFTNHFSHVNETTNCQGGYKETELHLLAKKILQDSENIIVPTDKYHYPKTLRYRNVRLEPLFPILEYKQYRPDIIITADDETDIAIEIFVSNNLSDIKKELYRKNNIQCLLIDISAFYRREIESLKSEITFAVLSETENKTWIWPQIRNELDTETTFNTKASTGSGCLLILVSIFAFFSWLCYWLKI